MRKMDRLLKIYFKIFGRPLICWSRSLKEYSFSNRVSGTFYHDKQFKSANLMLNGVNSNLTQIS